MSNQVQINGVPLTDLEIKAIQFSLESQIKIMKGGGEKYGHELNAAGMQAAIEILNNSQSALAKIITAHGVYYELPDEDITEQDIKNYTND